MNKQESEFAKCAALKFLGEEPNVREQFTFNTMEPPAPAAAPPILFEILDVLYQNSEILLNLFTTLTGTFIAYHLGRRAAKKQKLYWTAIRQPTKYTIF